MENSFPIASDVQHRQPTGTRAKVVMISSHAGWNPSQQETETEAAADPVDVVRIFHEVLDRVRHAPVLQMDDESVTVDQMIDQIWKRISMGESPQRLSQMLRIARTERAVICLELALLELVRLQAILLRQDRNLGDILLKRNAASL
jgi:segregation and condensation protein A